MVLYNAEIQSAKRSTIEVDTNVELKKVKAGKERLNFSVYRQCVQNFVAFSEYMNFDTVKIKFIYSEKTTKFEKNN